MTQTSNRLLDEFAKLMTDMAGVAQGVRREVETAFRSQAERFLGEMDLVQREEFDAVRDMAARAREENEALKKRIAALEAQLKARGRPLTGRHCFPVENPIAALAPLSRRTRRIYSGSKEIRIFAVSSRRAWCAQASQMPCRLRGRRR